MLSDPQCVFCKIVDGRIPSTLLHESERLVAFRDIAPVASTHVLVVPREHHPDVPALAAAAPDVLAELVSVAAQIAQAECDGAFRLMFNTGAAAGQSVFHVHAHVLGGDLSGRPPA